MSPDASAERTSPSETGAPRSTRSSYGFLATSEGCAASVMCVSVVRRAMEGAVDHVHLLFARQPHEVDGVTRYADGQAWIFLGMLHGVEQRFAVQHVDVHVEPGAAEVGVHDA